MQAAVLGPHPDNFKSFTPSRFHINVDKSYLQPLQIQPFLLTVLNSVTRKSLHQPCTGSSLPASAASFPAKLPPNDHYSNAPPWHDGFLHCRSFPRSLRYASTSRVPCGIVAASAGSLGRSSVDFGSTQRSMQWRNSNNLLEWQALYRSGFPNDHYHGCLSHGLASADVTIQGMLTPLQQGFHINYLELMAVQLALKIFFCQVHQMGVLVRTHNITAMYFLGKQGGTLSP